MRRPYQSTRLRGLAAFRYDLKVRPLDADSISARPHSSVAQWQSIRLLTGGLLVRVQPEEPVLSRIYGHSIFRPIFTLPFSEPISCGFFFGAQEQPDARIGGFVEVRG